VKCLSINANFQDFYDEILRTITYTVMKMKNTNLINTDPNDLANYYYELYELPLIERDKTITIKYENGAIIDAGKSIIYFYYPIVPKERLVESLSRTSSEFLKGGKFRDDKFKLTMEIAVGKTTAKEIEALIQNIELELKQQNAIVSSFNAKLKESIFKLINNRREDVKKTLTYTEALVTELPIKLELVNQDDLITNLTVKRAIKTLMPQPKKAEEVYLDEKSVNEIVNFMNGACSWFERTPRYFINLEEEALRDILIGGLNMIFQNDVSAETFTKHGKADIFLNIRKGNILVCECKIWSGHDGYLDAIDQLFGYLSWRENYGILINFCKNKNFTDVISEAKQAAIGHNTYIGNSIKDLGLTHFCTQHVFPEDSKKSVQIHHCLYDLYNQYKYNCKLAKSIN
jgi:hypothetical protein